jgi:hypothetical protein
MKKILFLLLVTISSSAQTYQNPTFGTVTEKTNAEDNSATKVKVQDSNGKSGWVNKSVFATSEDNPFKSASSIIYPSDLVYYHGDSQNLAREAIIYVNSPVTLPNAGNHTFGDYTTITQLAGGTGASAYASFDSKAVMNGTDTFGHLISFQARNNYNGSGNMSYMSGNENTIDHTGTGIISEAYAFHAKTKTGTGPITDLYGLKIDNQTGGTNNYALRTGSGKVVFGDEVNTNGVLLINNKSELISAQAKTVATANQYSFFGKTNEVSNYASLSLSQFGGATQAVRQWRYQTIEQGIANEGAITYQASGGRVLFGSNTDNGTDKVQITGNASGSLAASNSNHFTRKGEVDSVDALKANLAGSNSFTGQNTFTNTTGSGLLVNNGSTTYGQRIVNTGGSSLGLNLESNTGATGDLAVFTKNGVTTAKLDQNGNYIKTGGTADQALTAAGGVMTILTGSASLDFPSTAANSEANLTMTVTGAVIGDVIAIGSPAPATFTTYFAFVSATDTVTVRFRNSTVSAMDPVAATFKVKIFK